jgi:hypothetical protein
MNGIIDKTGEKHINNTGLNFTITAYKNSKNCEIQFEDGVIIKNVAYCAIKNGQVKNPYTPSVCGEGYMGIGKYVSRHNGIKTKAYNKWIDMLKRCYSNKLQHRQPSYKGTEVCENWKCFQIFAEWFENNNKEGFDLDKDILFKGNKIYSPETCCFIPREINTAFLKSDMRRGDFLIGVSKPGKGFRAHLSINGKRVLQGNFKTELEAFKAYKTAKEIEIKRLADKWKSQITDQVYEALYNYQVEITD